MSMSKGWHPDIVKRLEEATREDRALALVDVPERSVISVRTRNSLYRIALIRAEGGRAAVKGGQKLKAARIAYVRGSKLRDSSVIKTAFICVGLHLEIGRRGSSTVTTTPIATVVVEEDPKLWERLVAEAEENEPTEKAE